MEKKHLVWFDPSWFGNMVFWQRFSHRGARPRVVAHSARNTLVTVLFLLMGRKLTMSTHTVHEAMSITVVPRRRNSECALVSKLFFKDKK